MFMFDSTLSGTVSHTFTCDLIMTFTCDLITTFTYDLIYMWFDNNFYMCFDDNFYMWFDDDFYLWFNELKIVLFCLVAVCFFVVFEPQSVDLPDWHNFFSFAAFKQVPLNAFWRFAVNAFFVCVSCGCMKFKDWYPAIFAGLIWLCLPSLSNTKVRCLPLLSNTIVYKSVSGFM